MNIYVFCLLSLAKSVYFRSKVRKLMIAWIWLNSLFWSMAPLAGWSHISYEPSRLSCTVDMMHPDIGYKTYIVSCFIWCYVIPCVLMIYCRIKKRDEYYLIQDEREGYRVSLARYLSLFYLLQ